MQKVADWLRKSIISIFSITLFVVVCESIVRIADPDTYFKNRFFVINRDLDYPEVMLKDRTLFWKMRPGQSIASSFFDGETIHINSVGLRGAEIGGKGNRKRIVALGNSCSFGWGTNKDSTFVSQLGRLLGTNYEVINAGIPGYSSYQGRVFYEKQISELEPNILLILFGWNDHWPAGNKIQDKDQRFPPGIVLAIQNQLSRLYSYRLLKKWLLNVVEEDFSSIADNSEPVFRVGLDDFSANLKVICDRARASGVKPFLLTSPIPPIKDWGSNIGQSSLYTYHSKYNEAIRILARKENVELIDIAAEFEKHNGLFDRPSYDPIHFNAKGHRVCAEIISARIGSLDK